MKLRLIPVSRLIGLPTTTRTTTINFKFTRRWLTITGGDKLSPEGERVVDNSSSESSQFSSKGVIDPRSIRQTWIKTEEKLPIQFQRSDIKKLENACGPISPYLIIGRFPTSITPGDLFRLNQTNTTFRTTLEDYFFERSSNLDFTGFCHLKFTEVESAIQLCFDIFNIGGLTGGKTVTPKFETKEVFLSHKSRCLSKDGGAGSTVYISGLPSLTTAPDLVAWLSPYRIPLAFDGAINLAIKPIKPLKHPRIPSRPSHSKPKSTTSSHLPSSNFLVRLTSPAEAHHMVSLLHCTLFNPSMYGNRFPVSIKVMY